MVVHYQYPRDPRVSREAIAAIEAGYQVEVICTRGRAEPSNEVVDGVEVTRLDVTKSSERRGFISTLGEYLSFTARAAGTLAVRSLAKHRRYDIVQVHAPPDFLALAAVMPRLLGSKLVLDIHDLSPLIFAERFGERRGGRVAERALTVIERGACRLADAIITVHEPYVRELRRLGVSKNEVAVVMNSPNERVLEEAKRRAQPSREAETFVVAYHGTITPWYGVPLVVRALATAAGELGDWCALILGDGDAVPETRSLATRLGIADRLEFPGRFLPIEEALGLVAGADCGVIPNLPSPLNRLTLSTKLLEYVALEVPVVVARLDTIAEHFTPDEVTFFEPGNPRSLAEALLWVAGDRVAAKRKAERARKRLDGYSWAQSRDRYLRVLDALVGDGLVTAQPQDRRGDRAALWTTG